MLYLLLLLLPSLKYMPTSLINPQFIYSICDALDNSYHYIHLSFPKNNDLRFFVLEETSKIIIYKHTEDWILTRMIKAMVSDDDIRNIIWHVSRYELLADKMHRHKLCIISLLSVIFLT